MELVTREEFDIQTALLQRTRAQLDSLQKKLSELEGQLEKTDPEK
jgi:BMFP domain-containing protein YqiC